jgi:hypothetical protein
MKKIKPFSLFESEEEKSYSFSELSKEAQDKAVDYFYDINVYDDWTEEHKSYFSDQLDEFGIVDAKVYIESDSYNRFDVVFTTNNIDTKTLIKNVDFDPGKFEYVDFGEEFEPKDLSDDERELRAMMGDMEELGFEPPEKLDIEDVNFYVSYSSYSYRNLYPKNMEVEYDLSVDSEDFMEADKEIADKLIPAVHSFCVDACQKFANELSTNYETDTSREAIIDAIEGNDYRFDAEGNVV